MYSSKMCNMLRRSCQVSRATGSCPFAFNMKTQRLSVVPRLLPRAYRNFNLALAWSVAAFGLIIKRYHLPNKDNFHLTLSWWFGYNLFLLLTSIPRLFPHEICDHWNGLTKLLHQLHETYFENSDPNKSRLIWWKDIAVDVLTWSCIGIYLCNLLFILYDPCAVIYLGGLLPKRFLIFPVTSCLFMFQAYILGTVASTVPTIAGPIVDYGFYFYLLLFQELRLGRRAYISSDEMRRGQNVRIIFRALQILQQHALCICCMGPYLLIFNVLFTLSCTYFSFVLIRFWGDLKLFSRLPIVIADWLCFAYWTFILELGCLFFVGGNKTLGSWRRHNWGFQEQNRLMAKFLRSCKPILFTYGKTFVIGRVSVLTYYRSVSRGTARVLLTTK